MPVCTMLLKEYTFVIAGLDSVMLQSNMVTLICIFENKCHRLLEFSLLFEGTHSWFVVSNVIKPMWVLSVREISLIKFSNKTI